MNWDLTKLYKTEEAWESDFELFKSQIPKYESYRGKLSEKLKEYLEFDREISILGDRVGTYASLKKHENNADSLALERNSRLSSLSMEISDKTSWITPELMAIPDETYKEIANSPDMAEWQDGLNKLFRQKKHILSEAEERILGMSSEAYGAPSQIYDQLTDVDLKFAPIIVDGKEVEVTHGSYSSLMQHEDENVRKAVFESYYRGYEDHKYSLAETMTSDIKVNVLNTKIRGYSSSLAKSLYGKNVPESVYENLISAARGADKTQYFDIKGNKPWNFRVPLAKDFKRKTSFEDAKELVLKALAPLGDDYVNKLRDGFNNGWCSQFPAKGKSSGAFSMRGYKTPPYILMNYNEDVPGDIFTLAHEAGHSMHNLLTTENQEYQNIGYSIFLAEIASTFNECLLTDYLVKNSSPEESAFWAAKQAEDIQGTFFRQTMFAEFEKKTHECAESGKPLTLDTMTGMYKDLLGAYLPNVEIGEHLPHEYLRIPHFFNSFYVYQYATGISAAIQMSQRVINGEGPKFVLDFLKSGGVGFPIDTLKKAGVDLTTKEAFQPTIDLFNKRLSEFTELNTELKIPVMSAISDMADINKVI